MTRCTNRLIIIIIIFHAALDVHNSVLTIPDH